MTSNNSNNNSTPKPVQVFRAGEVKASVWVNTTSDGRPYFSVSIVRSYFDEEDKMWKDTVSYGRDDLPKVRLVADQAYECIFLKTQELSKEEKGFADKVEAERADKKSAGKGGKGAAA